MTDGQEPFYPQPPRTLRDVDAPMLDQAQLRSLDIQDLPYTQGNITKLKDWHRIFAEMQLMGKRNVDIARELDVHEMTLAKVQRSPIYKVYIGDLRKQAEEDTVFDVAAHLRKMTPKVFENLESLMNNAESETVRMSATKEYTDRISPKVTRIEAESKNIIYLESNTIQQLAQNLKESCNLTDANFDDKSDDEIIDLLESSIDKGEPDENKT